MEAKAVIGLRDQLFAHCPEGMSSGALNLPTRHLDFDRSGNPQRCTIFTDANIFDVFIDQSPVKIAWLLEPPEISGPMYEAIMQPTLYERFDMILTWHESLLRIDRRFVFMPYGGCWIAPEDRGIHPKGRNLSILASEKNFLPGHQMRHAAIQNFGTYFDGIYGRAYKPVEYKLEALQDFRFSLVIENVRSEYWFTEKLIDCFATGTIPVYWGCPSIGRFFNLDGIVVFNDLNELAQILPQLTEDEYERRLLAAEENLELVSRYDITEDYLYSYILKPHFGL